ncbi:hypothetical protein FRB98_001407 [Tulasnella sp. 332]|nr:hypothetical protein FRB98_001407 [Tulasnella sp. 332]
MSHRGSSGTTTASASANDTHNNNGHMRITNENPQIQREGHVLRSTSPSLPPYSSPPLGVANPPRATHAMDMEDVLPNAVGFNGLIPPRDLLPKPSPLVRPLPNPSPKGKGI